MKTQNTICAKCGASIPVHLESCPQCAPQISKAETVPVILIAVLLCSSFLMLGSSVVNVATAPSSGIKKEVKKQELPRDLTRAAYDAAKQFVLQGFPRTQSFSEFEQTPIDQKGNHFSVVFSTTGLTPQNTPVRNFFTVELEFSNGSWNLKQIKR